jgi:hypothetical protein
MYPILIAIGLFVVDAFVLSVGAMAFIMALAILFWFLPEVVLLKYPKVPLTKIAIYTSNSRFKKSPTNLIFSLKINME